MKVVLDYDYAAQNRISCDELLKCYQTDEETKISKEEFDRLKDKAKKLWKLVSSCRFVFAKFNYDSDNTIQGTLLYTDTHYGQNLIVFDQQHKAELCTGCSDLANKMKSPQLSDVCNTCKFKMHEVTISQIEKQMKIYKHCQDSIKDKNPPRMAHLCDTCMHKMKVELLVQGRIKEKLCEKCLNCIELCQHSNCKKKIWNNELILGEVSDRLCKYCVGKLQWADLCREKGCREMMKNATLVHFPFSKIGHLTMKYDNSKILQEVTLEACL